MTDDMNRDVIDEPVSAVDALATDTAPIAEEQPHAEEKKNDTPAPAPKKQEPQSPSLGSRLAKLLSSISVKYKISGTFVIILTVAVVSLGIVTFTRQNTILRNEMKSRAATLASQLANVGKEGLLTKQEMPVFAAIEDIQKRSDVVYAMVVDDTGKVFAHSDFSKKESVLSDAADRASITADALLFQEIAHESDSILDASMPITLKTKNLKIGVARVGLSEKTLSAAIRNQKTIYLWMALGFAICGFIASFMLARIITKPLDSLSEGIQIVARGDLRQLVEVRSEDEIGKLTTVFNGMILSLREKLLMEKYLSQSTVLSIKEHRDVTQLKLGGERKYVTALFSDARGFTALSEKLSPEEVVSLMNIYLNLQTTVIHQCGGIVDKFVGDEVMAIFEGRGMEVYAVRAAVEIQNYCRALNASRAVAGEKQINIGIGLNSGDVVMGNMGSEDHMDYTVIGDNINVAARLCGVAQPGQVLVSKATATEVGNQATWKELSPVQVKGKDQPIPVAEATAVQGGARKFMRRATDESVTYSLEGFLDESNKAVIKNICPAGCLLEVSGPIGIGSKLSVNLNMVDLGLITVHSTVYHARKQGEAYYIGLCFNDLSEDAKNHIIHWIHQVNAELVKPLFA